MDNQIVILISTMVKINSKEINETAWLIRRVFRLMGVRAEQYLKDLNVSACERAMMDCLYPEHKISVPQIARLYDVSRQHVQATVNSLLENELVELIDNPKHKRSALVTLSKNGLSLYEEIRLRDEQAYSKVFSNIAESDNAITHQTLKQLVDNLSTEINHNNPKEAQYESK